MTSDLTSLDGVLTAMIVLHVLFAGYHRGHEVMKALKGIREY